MKINSIFKGRLYNLPVNDSTSFAEKKIIKRILKACEVNVNIDKASLVYVEEDYDFYTLKSGNVFYDLKFSLDTESENFSREIKNSKTCKSKHVAKYLNSGLIKVGDNISYLLCENKYSESLFDYGRSIFSQEFDSFCNAYVEFASCGNYRLTYQNILKKYVKESDISSVFDGDQKSYIANHSDYLKCESIVNSLKSEINNYIKKIPKVYTGNILGDINKNSIFVGEPSFIFKDLRFACKGHIYSDIANAVLYYGLNENFEKSLVDELSKKMRIPIDRGLYKFFYELELRRKALYYLLQYLKEVYLYESMRMETIINIIDSFSQSYKRLCKIPVFKDNKDFILKNITEPILERKPLD